MTYIPPQNSRLQVDPDTDELSLICVCCGWKENLGWDPSLDAIEIAWDNRPCINDEKGDPVVEHRNIFEKTDASPEGGGKTTRQWQDIMGRSRNR